MIVVSDASPLITLARIGYLDLLPSPFGRVVISPEVYAEVTIAGAGLPGAVAIAEAGSIEVIPVQRADILLLSIKQTGLGAGEVSTVALAKDLAADLVLLDEWKARRYATVEGLAVMGCIGILEICIAVAKWRICARPIASFWNRRFGSTFPRFSRA